MSFYEIYTHLSLNRFLIYYFSFPNDEDKRQVWLQQLNLNGGVPPNSVVCHVHFNPTDVIKKRQKNKWKYFLAPGAIPINNFEQESRIQNNVNAEDDISSQDNEMIEVRVLNPTLKGVSKNEDVSVTLRHKMRGLGIQNSFTETEILKKRNLILSKQIANLRTQNRLSKQLIRRKNRKIKDLEALINKQKEELAKCVPEDTLNRKMTPPMKELFDKIMGRQSDNQYNEILKRFSIELDFISPRAYR